MTQKTAKQFSPELRERAVRMVQGREREGGTQWASVGAIAAKIGCSRETLRRWVRQGERDAGQRPGPTTDERERIRALEREVRELRQVNEILRKASACFAQAELDRPLQAMTAFIDEHRGARGVEPICRVLPAKPQSGLREIAPSTYHAYAALPMGVQSVATRPAYRGRGLSRRLLGRALRWCDAQAGLVFLMTSIPGFYEPLGFMTVPQFAYVGVPPPIPLGAPSRRLDFGLGDDRR